MNRESCEQLAPRQSAALKTIDIEQNKAGSAQMYGGGEILNYSDSDHKSGQLADDLCQQPLLITLVQTIAALVRPI